MQTSHQSHTIQATHDTTPQPHDGRVIIQAKPGKIIRLPSVEDRTGLKKSSIYALEKEGCFPARVRLSARAVGWREDEIESWISERVKTGAQS